MTTFTLDEGQTKEKRQGRTEARKTLRYRKERGKKGKKVEDKGDIMGVKVVREGGGVEEKRPERRKVEP